MKKLLIPLLFLALSVHAERPLENAIQDLEAGHWKEARKKIKTVLSENKKRPEAWVILGRTYFATGRYRKTLSRCKKALKYNPHFAPAYYWRGQAYERRGKLDEAANEYQAALQSDPTHGPSQEAWTHLKNQVSVSEK
jgi:tetratricopeptide (TPR) repeat protein